MKVETMVLRVLVAPKVPQGSLARQASGVVLELMVPVGCLENQVLRVTEDLMDFLGCLVKKDTGENQDQWDP